MSHALAALPGDLRERPSGAAYLSLSVLTLTAAPLAYLGGNMPVVAGLFLLAGLGWLKQADDRLEGEP